MKIGNSIGEKPDALRPSTCVRDRLRAAVSFTSEQWIVLTVLLGVFLKDTWLAVLVSLLTIYIMCRKRYRDRMVVQPSFFPTALMLPILLAPGIVSGYAYGIITGVAVWLIMMYAGFLRSVMTVDFYSRLLDILLLMSIVIAAVGLYCQRAGILYLGRVSSVFESPNHYGYVIEIFVLAAVCQFVRRRNPIYIAVAIVNLLCNIMCDCRTAWASVAVGLAVFLFLCIKKTSARIWTAAVTCLGGTGLFAAAAMHPEIGKRMTLEAIMRSLGNRVVYWRNAWEWFLERPLFGYGVCSYKLLSEMNGERVLAHAHSLLLNFLLDIGIVGTVVLVYMLIRLTGNAFRHEPDREKEMIRNLVIAVMAATLVHGITDVPVLGVSTSIIMLMVLTGAGCLSEPLSSPEARLRSPAKDGQ